ncbi:MAG: DUF177 domain-containing protein [Chitinophagales bacterium]|nr:DUF177 domain-containing protein [Bacteroidota bacterium]MCB9042363.1 DUF177 domain-containing protein [Chitinophagales bacterium]
MKPFQKYDIPVVGLKLGAHVFTYDIDANFFAQFEHSPIDKAQINVHLDLNKKANFFILDFQLSGVVDTECDRCSDPLALDIEGAFRVLLKYEEDAAKSDVEEDIVYISRNDYYFNVAQLIYEFAVLSLPTYKIHPPDDKGASTCNPQIIALLNKEKESDTTQNDIDPRWAALEKFKKNNKK